jgi:symplekin
LVDSQVSSVRKIIKLKLLSLLKHPASFDFQPQITTLLTDLGATQAEVYFYSFIKFNKNYFF